MLLAERLDRHVAFDHCRHLLPCFRWARATDSSARLHRLALELSRPGALAAGPGTRLLSALCFLCSGLRQIALAHRRQGAAARRIHRIPHHRQLRNLLHTVFRRNAAPQSCYTHRLFRPAELRRADRFFEHHETQLLLGALHARLDTAALSDKLRFHDLCQSHELPTVPLLAVFRDGAPDPDRSGPWLAGYQGDVFAKPATDYAGHGIVRWCYDTTTARYSDGTRARSPAELGAALAAASTAGHVTLLQPRLHEGPTLRDLAGDAVCNYRVLTGCAPGAAPVLLTAVLRLPTPGHYLTDLANDIFAAPVDLATATLGAARAKELARGEHLVHPVNGAPIAGRLIANWDGIAALVLRAHAACPWMPFVGWDVVDSATGPVLLEANAYWGANLCQLGGHRFLGETPFPEIYLAHLARLRPDLLPSAA